MVKARITALILVVISIFLGYFTYVSETNEDSVFGRFPFSLGLDLAGGTHLIYRADLATVPADEVDDSLSSLRDVIERRVNIFGVSEPRVQIEKRTDEEGGTVGRLIVELPGVTDVDEATELIGQTPVLEFRIENPDVGPQESRIDEESGLLVTSHNVQEELTVDDIYLPSGLSGKHLKKAQVQFNHITGEPLVSLTFNDEGAELFEEITRANIGKTVAIFLDGAPISIPVVQQEISGGQAQITGSFTLEEVRTLVGRLNAGALPVSIFLLSSETIGATLGEESIALGVTAGIWGLVLVSFFFIFWYRLPGVLAILSLSFYMMFMFALFKLIPVTLTASGIAGFILSIGLAVDANVLIFERFKEERGRKKSTEEAIREAFSRAWPSIRDANTSSIITAVILFWFGTSLIKGFALTFGLGVLVSMFSAIVLTKMLMLSVNISQENVLLRFGFRK